MNFILKFFILVIVVVLIAFIGINSCAYLNLNVSEKYETQPEGFANSSKALQISEKRKQQIDKEKKSVKLKSAISAGAVIILLFVYFKTKKE